MKLVQHHKSNQNDDAQREQDSPFATTKIKEMKMRKNVKKFKNCCFYYMMKMTISEQRCRLEYLH